MPQPLLRRHFDAFGIFRVTLAEARCLRRVNQPCSAHRWTVTAGGRKISVKCRRFRKRRGPIPRADRASSVATSKGLSSRTFRLDLPRSPGGSRKVLHESFPTRQESDSTLLSRSSHDLVFKVRSRVVILRAVRVSRRFG
jgi:hypothetical protein